MISETKKTDIQFIIHNFNTIPDKLLEYCENYIIYDASTDVEIKTKLKDSNYNIRPVINTGHNITTIFSYFVDFYDYLPEVICLVKGNILGRHCTEDFFNKVYDNHYFTYIYEDNANMPKDKNIAFLAMENQYLELNNSWYVNSPSHPKRYFNDLLKFIYVVPIIPQYCIFAPGANYIVLKEQVIKHSPEFYKNLYKIMSYGMDPNFPSEAHMIERMLPIIFQSNYEVNYWMNDEKLFYEKLEEEQLKVELWKTHQKVSLKSKLKDILRLK